MAIALDDMVMVANRNTEVPFGAAATPTVQPQPPIYGWVTAEEGGGTVPVLWQTGHLIAAIAVSALDVVRAPLPASAALVGQVVRVASVGTTGESSDYTYVVQTVFRRERAGLGVISVDLALLRTRSGPLGYREIAVALLEVTA